VSTNNESDTSSGSIHGGDHPYKVDVRTLAGHTDVATVKPSETVGALRDKEVTFFISKGWLTAGDYALTLPRVSENELDPTATLGDLGVAEGDTLVLINRKPHVDGADGSAL